MKTKRLIVSAAAAVMVIAGILFLNDDLMSPYVSFDDAMKEAGSYVQVIGKLDKGAPVKQADDGFSFVMANDSGSLMNVVYHDVKPVNFEHAESVVVLGRFEKEQNCFMADRVLTKCPSKYTKEKK